MAEELLEEQLAQPGQEAPSQEQPAEPEQKAEPEPPQEPKKKREFLLPLLTLLLIVLGISEAVFWGYFGFSSYRHGLAVERYEAQQKALEEERAAMGVTGGSAYGPNLKVENGTVTWQREDWISAGTSTAGGGPASVPEDTSRLSRPYVANIPYTLADPEEAQPRTDALPEGEPATT